MASLAKPMEQITGIVGGKIVPATDTPLLTSASTPLVWLSARKAQCRRQTRHLVGMASGACRSHHQRPDQALASATSAAIREYVARAGNVCIFPSGFDETLFSISELKFEAIVVELDPALLETLLGRPHGGFDQHSRPADRHTRSLRGPSAESNGCGGRSRLSCRGTLRPCVVPGIGHLSRPNVFGEEAH